MRKQQYSLMHPSFEQHSFVLFQHNVLHRLAFRTRRKFQLYFYSFFWRYRLDIHMFTIFDEELRHSLRTLFLPIFRNTHLFINPQRFFRFEFNQFSPQGGNCLGLLVAKTNCFLACHVELRFGQPVVEESQLFGTLNRLHYIEFNFLWLRICFVDI